MALTYKELQEFIDSLRYTHLTSDLFKGLAEADEYYYRSAWVKIK